MPRAEELVQELGLERVLVAVLVVLLAPVQGPELELQPGQVPVAVRVEAELVVQELAEGSAY